MSIAVHELAVFTDTDGHHGNPLGIVPNASALDDAACQRIAGQLGYSETVFMADDLTRIRIFTPATKFAFAGHPTVGACWFLAQQGYDRPTVACDAGDIRLHPEPDVCSIEADPEWGPAWELRQVRTPAEIDALEREQAGDGVYWWAWIDAVEGVVRARSFHPSVGVPEDEATGSAALRLAAHLGRDLEIHQGRGSMINVEPTDDPRMYRLGGRVREVRRFEIEGEMH